MACREVLANETGVTGTLKGDTLTFSYSISYKENTLVLTVVALVKGNTFSGSVDFGGNGEAAFSATKVATPRKPEGWWGGLGPSRYGLNGDASMNVSAND